MIKGLIKGLKVSLIQLSQGFIGLGLSYYGEKFSANVLRRFYARAITPVIANTDYEGTIKEGGDRVNVKMFLEDIDLTDYTIGTDMGLQHPVDTEASLIVDQKKYYNFDIDKVDKHFDYVNDEDSTLINNAAKALEKAVDQRLLQVYIEEVAAGNRIPHGSSGDWNFVIGDSGTYVTITTAASYGVATLTGAASGKGTYEYFPVDIVGRGFRVTSDKSVSPWYKITVRTSSTVIRFTNWDSSLLGDDPTASTSYVKFPFEDNSNCLATSSDSCGCQIEGMKATQVTKTNVYALITDLATCLDNYDVPQENRHLSVPPWFKNILVQASQLEPDIAMYHDEVVINGRVARVAGFDVHMVSADRFSTDAEPIYPNGTADAGTTGYKILANHIGFITFAHAWSESRVIEAQLQFANLYQGLNLYGFLVLNVRRGAGAYLYGYY